MNSMFENAESFSGDLSSWDVLVLRIWGNVYGSSASKAIYQIECFKCNGYGSNSMFENAESFNQNVSNWDISSSWDVSSVTIMRWMFYGASSFNQNLSNWDIASVTDMEGIFNGETGLNDINKCYMDDAFQNNAVWPYEWVGHCQPSLSEIADASILEDETYTIDLEPFGVFLTF